MRTPPPMNRRPKPPIAVRSVLLLLGWTVSAHAYDLGFAPGGPPALTSSAARELLAASGCGIAVIPVRLDVFLQPNGRSAADPLVSAVVEAGALPLLRLLPGPSHTAELADGTAARTREPAGLTQPVFAVGGAEPAGHDRINPDNLWAQFVYGLVERYDGDGLADAPGSPTVESLLLLDQPDAGGTPEVPLPDWPGAGLDRLSRLLAASHAAADYASEGVRIGLSLAAPETLDQILAQAGYQTAAQLDFVDYRADAQPGSDLACFAPRGLAGRAEAFAAVGQRRGLYGLRLYCSGAGVTPDAAPVIQRATVVKLQVVGAAEQLESVLQPAVGEPGATPGLLLDPRLTALDPAVPRPTDGWSAYLSAARLLGPQPRFSEAVTVGNTARCYRFQRDGDELLVAWAYDQDGDPDRRATFRLPGGAGTFYYRYGWDYVLTGEPRETLQVGEDGCEVTVGPEPEYFLAAAQPVRCERLPPPAPLPSSPWRVTSSSSDVALPAALAHDGDPASRWQAAGDELQPWWRLECLDGPVTTDSVRLRLGPSGRGAKLEVSDDGQVWRTVGQAKSTGWGWSDIRLGHRVSSRFWRVVFDAAIEPPAALYELRLGGNAPELGTP